MVLVFESTLNSVLHPSTVGLVVSRVVLRDGRLPKHNTTKHAVALERLNKHIGVLWGEVVVLVCRKAIFTCSQSKVELNVWVLGVVL